MTAVPPARVSIYPILTVNFVGTLGFSIVLPFLVFLVTRLGGNALIYGVMGATYSFFQLIGAPILGRWSDRYGPAVQFGVHGVIAEHYGSDLAQFGERPTTLDYLVAAAGG